MVSYTAPAPVDPGDSEVVFSPEREREGYWVGAPCAHVHEGTTYLAVRRRTPADRGYEVAIYERDGGYERVATVEAAALGASSVERPALVSGPEGVELFLPVDRGEGDWGIVKLAAAADPSGFDPTTARTVLTPGDGTDAATVKDPVVVRDDRYYMYYAGHDGHSEQAHLATSTDGERWERSPANPVLPRGGWHDFHTRIACVLPHGDEWFLLYDGSGRSDYRPQWNLRTGVGTAGAPGEVEDRSPAEPWLSMPHGSAGERFTTCRYADVLRRGDEWELFFEAARPDGAFELRRTTVDAAGG